MQDDLQKASRSNEQRKMVNKYIGDDIIEKMISARITDKKNR